MRAQHSGCYSVRVPYDAGVFPSYSRDEVHTVAAKLLATQKKVKNLKRIILAGAAAVVLGSALVLGIVFAANEASKEVKAGDRQLQDTNGNDIITATAKYAVSVGDFNPVEDIQFMDDMVATDANGVEYSLHIDGWAIDWDNTGIMTVFLAHGFKITIHPGSLNADGTTATAATMSFVMPDGSTNTYFEFADVLDDLVAAPAEGAGRLLREVSSDVCEEQCGNGFSGTQRGWRRAPSRRPGFRLGGRDVCRCSNSRVNRQQFGNSQRQGAVRRGTGSTRGPLPRPDQPEPEEEVEAGADPRQNTRGNSRGQQNTRGNSRGQQSRSPRSPFNGRFGRFNRKGRS